MFPAHNGSSVQKALNCPSTRPCGFLPRSDSDLTFIAIHHFNGTLLDANHTVLLTSLLAGGHSWATITFPPFFGEIEPTVLIQRPPWGVNIGPGFSNTRIADTHEARFPRPSRQQLASISRMTQRLQECAILSRSQLVDKFDSTKHDRQYK